MSNPGMTTQEGKMENELVEALMKLVGAPKNSTKIVITLLPMKPPLVEVTYMKIPDGSEINWNELNSVTEKYELWPARLPRQEECG